MSRVFISAPQEEFLRIYHLKLRTSWLLWTSEMTELYFMYGSPKEVTCRLLGWHTRESLTEVHLAFSKTLCFLSSFGVNIRYWILLCTWGLEAFFLILGFLKVFIWLHWVLVVAHRSVHCGALDSVVVSHKLICLMVRGILVPPPGIEPASSASEGGFLTTGPQGSPCTGIYSDSARFCRGTAVAGTGGPGL